MLQSKNISWQIDTKSCQGIALRPNNQQAWGRLSGTIIQQGMSPLVDITKTTILGPFHSQVTAIQLKTEHQ